MSGDPRHSLVTEAAFRVCRAFKGIGKVIGYQCSTEVLNKKQGSTNRK